MPPSKRRRTQESDSTLASSPVVHSSPNIKNNGDAIDEVVNIPSLDAIGEEYDAIIRELTGPYAFIQSLLLEFWSALQTDPRNTDNLVISSDSEWFWFTEMRFLIIFLYEMSFMEYALCVTRPDSITTTAHNSSTKATHTHRADMQQRVAFLERLRRYVTDLGRLRLHLTVVAGRRLPRVFRLAKRYRLSEPETDLFQLLVVFQGCQSNAVRCQMIEEDAQRKLTSCQRLAAISEIDVAEFYDDEREHVKEGTLIVDEENYSTALSLSNICVRVLLGRPLSNNQMLKLSQTALEEVLKEEGVRIHEGDGHDALFKKSKKLAPCATMNGHREVESSSEGEMEEKQDETTACAFINGYASMESGLRKKSTLYKRIPHIPTIETAQSETSMKPYNPTNQLEYLEDRFQVIAYAIRASGARVKDQMKEAGTKQVWEPTVSTGGPGGGAGRRELKAKLRVHDRKTLHRLELTRKAGLSLPRLEELSIKFKLNKFEQNVIVMLIGKTISPVIKNLLDGIDTSAMQRMDESIIINQILSVFCDTFQEQVAHRVFFYKSSRLLSKGLVKLHRGRWHATSGDLVDQRVELDRRVLDWVVGLDTEMNELVEGSDLYYPKVCLDQVILPEDHKATILQTVESYEAFRTFRKKSGLEETFAYGTGLVLLLCGASGTGKTMTVNAVAHHLKKRVLLVDFPSLQGKRQEGMEVDADLRGLFREAEMSNAVLFFDECETIFKQREMGGDRLLNALLTEIERYEGIVFLATNRPFDLDEAMHRRITAVFEFKAPDHLQRRKIWQVLVNKALTVAEDVDWDLIALKYELSGGFIKNAILSALLQAIGRDPNAPILHHADLVAGCALQMRGSLHMKTFDHRVVPTTGLETLIVEERVKEKLEQIVHFEKARNVIYGQWGFDFTQSCKGSQQKGINVLLCGPPGVGKVSAAKAIGFEIGRPLKLVHFAQLQCDSLAETRKTMRAVFDDARLMDAVLVLDGFESFGSHLEIGGIESMESSPRVQLEMKRLLEMLEGFPGISILIATVPVPSISGLINSEFARRLKFTVEMRNPSAKLREKRWRASFPSKAPVDPNVDFKKLAERFELNHTAISDAVFRAAASAALRPTEERCIMMKDLMDAAEVERKKAKGSNAMDSLFV